MEDLYERTGWGSRYIMTMTSKDVGGMMLHATAEIADHYIYALQQLRCWQSCHARTFITSLAP